MAQAPVLGKRVGAIGYGLMGFTWRPEPTPHEQAFAAMRAALANGCTVWNGAEFYGTPENNSMTLLKAYFTKYPEDADKVTLVMKGGYNAAEHRLDSSPEGTRKSLDNIIAQLGGTKKVDVYDPARRDPTTPLDVTLGVVQKEYIDTGKIGGVGVSECSAETIHEAAKHVKVAICEVEFSMFTPDILKNGVAAACAEHNIPILAYSPIGRGLLTGRFTDSSQLKYIGHISNYPRLQEEAFNHNMKLVEQAKALAAKKGCTVAQLAIGWVRCHSNHPGQPTVIPIPGSTTPERVEENAKAVDLTEEEMKSIDEIVYAFEVSGTRYPAGAPVNT